MATEERLIRLENAFATLAELASNQHERANTLEQSLAELASEHHERIFTLEQSFQMLVQLAQSADERMDQHLAWINQLGEAQANTESKLAALTDAQIRTDEALSRLADSQARLADSQARLAESQVHTDQRLDALIDIVREWRNGKP
jgi:DNA repair exonuclease SbcCD ATPase subunit